MNIGLDASNLISGGGITHLYELLKHANQEKHKFDTISVWSNDNTLKKLPKTSWIKLYSSKLLNGNGIARAIWRLNYLDSELRQKECDILFAPGGTYRGRFAPFVTMSRNMLPFENKEIARYGIFSVTRVKLELLKRAQLASLDNANGYIFLQDYAKRAFEVSYRLPKKYTIIPHGISTRFQKLPRVQRDILSYTHSDPFRLLYVSTVNKYKHQWNVIEAVSKLRNNGYPIRLDLVGGSSDNQSLRRLNNAIKINDPKNEYVNYWGKLPYDKLEEFYHQADSFIFASSCENMPNILLEAMSAGLPVVCSNQGPMVEILGSQGLYFDPESVEDLIKALERTFKEPLLRSNTALHGYTSALEFSWEKCADLTFGYLNRILSDYRGDI